MSRSELQLRLSASRKLDSLESSSMDSLTSYRSNAGAMSLPTDSGGSVAAPVRRSGAVLRRAAGFNLVELLVVITIASILMGIGVPSYRYVTNSNRVASEVNALLGDMMIARSEAIKEGQTVTVCPSKDGATCDANTTDWSEGWIVFTDFNANGTVDAGAPNNDTVMRYQQGFGNTDTFVTTNAVNNWVSFNRDGFAIGLPTNGTQHLIYSLHTTPVNDQWTRCLELTLAGMMTTEHKGIGGCT
jgi:type IV fimbrial biogenesis protein FimT